MPFGDSNLYVVDIPGNCIFYCVSPHILGIITEIFMGIVICHFPQMSQKAGTKLERNP